jgi:hypothetical protein
MGASKIFTAAKGMDHCSREKYRCTSVDACVAT